MSNIKHAIAQLGCGYWGPNLLRNFSNLPGCRVKYVVDASPDRRQFVESNYPLTKGLDVDESDIVWNDPEVTAVIIATPAGTHYALSKKALESGKHIFVEKPLATKESEVAELKEIAARNGLTILAGHTFIYNAAVRYVKNLIDSGTLGEIRYIYSQRLNLGRIRTDIDALWNFAPHDISIIQYWLGDPEPLEVQRQGMDYMQSGVDDVVFLNIVYPGKIMANIHVSWLDPQKVRKMIVVGSKKMVVYDDISENKIAIYDKGIDRPHILGENMDFDSLQPIPFDYRSGDLLIPQINFTEPLKTEAKHFIDCIESQETPETGVEHARRVVSILERASNPVSKEAARI